MKKEDLVEKLYKRELTIPYPTEGSPEDTIKHPARQLHNIITWTPKLNYEADCKRSILVLLDDHPELLEPGATVIQK